MKQTKYFSRISEKIHEKYPDTAFLVIVDSSEVNVTFSYGHADNDFCIRAAAHFIKRAAYGKKKGIEKVIGEVNDLVHKTELRNLGEEKC